MNEELKPLCPCEVPPPKHVAATLNYAWTRPVLDRPCDAVIVELLRACEAALDALDTLGCHHLVAYRQVEAAIEKARSH